MSPHALGLIDDRKSLGPFTKLIVQLIVAAALIMLAAVPPEPRVPAWMVVVIVLRELAVTGLRGIASRGGVTLAAQELGKYKMILQVFALEGLLLHYAYPIPGTGLVIDFHAGGMVFLWMALVLAVWSGADYYVRILRQILSRIEDEVSGKIKPPTTV